MKTNLLKTYTYIFLRKGLLTKFFIVFACVLSVSYCTLLVKTIHTVSERKVLRTEVRNTQARISELETKYFELASSIDQKYVAHMGFTEVYNPVFAYTHNTHDNNDGALAMNTLLPLIR